jgi:large subunit ribosomal protein L23
MKSALKIIKGPRITEKGTVVAELSNSYVFDVAQDATKGDIKKAIKEIYKVVPVKVTVVNSPLKKVFARGKRGEKGGGRKAYVFLKKGDSIQFV